MNKASIFKQHDFFTYVIILRVKYMVSSDPLVAVDFLTIVIRTSC